MTAMVAGSISAAVTAVYCICEIYSEYDQLKNKRNELESKLRILKQRSKHKVMNWAQREKTWGYLTCRVTPSV